jgi:transcriptional regulator with XRE-family HTH domain
MAAGTMKRTSLHTPEYAALVALLRDLRLEAGLSQAETAEKVDRPQTWLSALEVGGRGLDILHVRELVAVYGLDFPDFAMRLEATIKAQPYRPPRRRRADAKAPAVPAVAPTQLPAKSIPVAVAKPVAAKPDAKASAKTRAKPATKQAATPTKKPGRKPSR